MKQNQPPPNPFWQNLTKVLKPLHKHLERLKKELLKADSQARFDNASSQFGKTIEQSKKAAKGLSAQIIGEAKKGISASKKYKNLLTPKQKMYVYVGLGLAFLMLLSWRLFFNSGPGFPSGMELANFDPRPTVEADVAQTHTITRKVKAVGSLKATDSAVMKAEVGGVVAKVNFQDGAAVKQGDLLIALDDSVLKAEYEARASEYRQNKSEYERYEELTKRHIVPALQRDQARSKMEVAYSQMRLAEARLGQYKLVAPFDGLIGLRDVSVGSYVQAAQEMITVVKLNPMKVDFKVPEAYLSDLELGQEAVVTVDGFNKNLFVGKIEAIDPKIDPSSHSIQVRASFDNIDAKIRPGIFANVLLTLGQKTDALMIPESSIDRSGSDEYVYVLRDIRGEKVAIRTVVTTGLREEGKVEILDGLTPGNEVVTAGHTKIRDGFQVRVVERLVPDKAVTDPISAAGKMLGKPAADLVSTASHMLKKDDAESVPSPETPAAPSGENLAPRDGASKRVDAPVQSGVAEPSHSSKTLAEPGESTKLMTSTEAEKSVSTNGFSSAPMPASPDSQSLIQRSEQPYSERSVLEQKRPGVQKMTPSTKSGM